MGEVEVECKSLQDLGNILEGAKQLGISVAIIGGYAVRAYTAGYRYTKDIDLIAEKPGVGKLRGLLKDLGYQVRKTEFGISGKRKLDEAVLDLHISVSKVFDVSTGLSFECRPAGAKLMRVAGYHKESERFALKAPVIDLESLLALKLMPVGRDKDTVDVLSLLIDRGNEIRIQTFAARCGPLRDHILERMRNYLNALNRGELDRLWFKTAGATLRQTDKKEIRRMLSQLVNGLRAMR